MLTSMIKIWWGVYILRSGEVLMEDLIIGA